MTLLIVYVLVALVFSFLCSIAEAVLLSVTPAYVAVLSSEGKASGVLLSRLRSQIHRPLAAILTLNTIAHTIGAAGAGAQAAIVFGSAYLGLASAILTLLILVFSEIIPKTLGATHWRRLAPATAHGLRVLIWLLYPFVWLAARISGGVAESNTLNGFSRSEFAAMADVSAEEGQLARRESEIVKNLMSLRRIRVHDAMTPRTVIFSLSASTTVEEFFHKHDHVRFSRIPIYKEDPDQVEGFVLRSDMLLAQARGNTHKPLDSYRRDMPAIPETVSLARAFNLLMRMESHVALVVDEYGDLQGLLTLEDILETLLGLEIVDEGDASVDMQEFARRQWRKRARKMQMEAVTDAEDGPEN